MRRSTGDFSSPVGGCHGVHDYVPKIDSSGGVTILSRSRRFYCTNPRPSVGAGPHHAYCAFHCHHKRVQKVLELLNQARGSVQETGLWAPSVHHGAEANRTPTCLPWQRTFSQGLGNPPLQRTHKAIKQSLLWVDRRITCVQSMHCVRGASCRSHTRVLFCFQVFFLGHQSILVFYEQPGNASDLISVWCFLSLRLCLLMREAWRQVLN